VSTAQLTEDRPTEAIDLAQVIAQARTRVSTSLAADGRGRAALVLADLTAAMIAGAREPELQHLAARWNRARSEATARVLVPGASWAEPADAAFVNASAAVVHELDEGLPFGGHPAAHIAPVALALAQRHAIRGSVLLEAFLVGYEVAGRLHEQHRLRAPAHPHGTLSTIGAATTAALLTDADPVAAARIAAGLPVLSTWSSCFEGVTSRHAVVGAAARIAVLASDLAHAGFDGTSTSLQEAYGEIAGSRTRAPAPADGLLIDRTVLKVHGWAAPCHAAIEAAVDLAAGQPEQLQRIVLETSAKGLRFAQPPEPNDISARFSSVYGVASALHGRSTLLCRYDDAVMATAGRIEVLAAPDLENVGGVPARLTCTDRSGTTVSSTILSPAGAGTRPLSEARIRAKFVELVAPLGPELFDHLLALDDCENVAELFPAEL
jgi:2-methylcitrate dehydratase PrpD